MKKSTQFHHLMVIEPNEPIYCKLNKDKTGLKEVVTDFVVNDEWDLLIRTENIF